MIYHRLSDNRLESNNSSHIKGRLAGSAVIAYVSPSLMTFEGVNLK